MTTNIPIEHDIHVSLDGARVPLPSGIKSFQGICSLLNSLAQQQRRIVASFSVEIEPIYVAAAWSERRPMCRIAATTTNAETLHLGIVQTALRQVEDARERVRNAMAEVQINDGCIATENWRELTEHLQQPLETMRKLPADFSDSAGVHPDQLRRWQSEQLAAVRSEVDEACRRKDCGAILHALENRVMSWLDNLRDLLSLWRETLLLGFRAAA